MKIKDLIKKLKKYNQDHEVGLYDIEKNDVDYNLKIHHHTCSECEDKFIFFYTEDIINKNK